MKTSTVVATALATSVAAVRRPEDVEAPRTRRLGQGNAVNLFNSNQGQGDSPVDYDGPTGQIVGGKEVDPPRKYGFFAHLDGCGGSLIAPNVVLSAAHCEGSTNSVALGAHKRIVGENDLSELEELEIIPIAESVPHPNYKKNSNDFWLIKLAWPTQKFAGEVVDIDRDLVHADGDLLTVLGFGDTESGGSSPEVMHEVDVNYISNEVCWGTYGYREREIDDSMLCAGIAGEGGKDTCQGDSGGPIIKMVNDSPVLLGVTSWGYGCARANYPGVYGRVSNVIGWIDDYLDAWTSGDMGAPDDPWPAVTDGKVDYPVNWFDDDGPGYNCLWYGMKNNCGDYGDSNANVGKTANQACAVCGGGAPYAGGPPAPITPEPTSAPTTPPTVPTPGPPPSCLGKNTQCGGNNEPPCDDCCNGSKNGWKCA